MASTYSTNLALELIGTGDQAGTWGNTTNTNLGTLIEQAISGYVTQAVATGTDTTITIPNGATGVARNMYIELTGTGGASTNLIVPSNKKLYFIYNNSTGAVTVKVSGQTGVSVATGEKVVLVSNGTDVVNAVSYLSGASANITTLTVTSANITTLTSTSANITTLTGTSTNITTATHASANITTLTSTSANVTNLSVGTTRNNYDRMFIGGTLPADGGSSYALDIQPTFPVTGSLVVGGVVSPLVTTAASAVISEILFFWAGAVNKGAGSTVTSVVSFYSGGPTAGTNNYAFYSGMAAASNRWGFYSAGTARNYFAGGVEVVSGTTGMTTGFTHIPAAAGAPTGAPTNPTGNVPMYYDTTNNKIYVYNGGWKATAALT